MISTWAVCIFLTLMELKHIVLIDKNSRRTFKTTHAIVTMRHFRCKYEIYARTFAPVPFRDTNISIKNYTIVFTINWTVHGDECTRQLQHHDGTRRAIEDADGVYSSTIVRFIRLSEDFTKLLCVYYSPGIMSRSVFLLVWRKRRAILSRIHCMTILSRCAYHTDFVTTRCRLS